MAAVALALTTGGAASATAGTPAAASSFVLTISPVTSTGNGPTSVRLECDPAGGTHPTPDAACVSLAAVNGNFDRLPSSGFCPAYYDPVVATATGTWRGVPVYYEEQFTNRSCASVGTDYVFGF
jgi:hypothetical protein